MKKILVIDDEPSILDAIQIMLESEGYKVETLRSASNLSHFLKNNKPDLLLLDVLLSGEDGRNIARCLKNQKNTKNLPIVMISAHPNVAQSYKDCGADDFLAKPFDIDDLLSKIKKYID